MLEIAALIYLAVGLAVASICLVLFGRPHWSETGIVAVVILGWPALLIALLISIFTRPASPSSQKKG